MTVKKYNVKFFGYRCDSEKSEIPNIKGLYCVYTAIVNKIKGKADLNELIYIGESDDVCNRITNHDKYTDWKKHLKSGQELCYSWAELESDRVRCEAALIHEHQPTENSEYKKSFPFDDTEISLEGTIAKLKSNFTVKKR